MSVYVTGMNYIELNVKDKFKQDSLDKLSNKERAKVIKDEVKYIGRCYGAENNGEHSLFGSLDGNDDLQSVAEKDIVNYMQNKAKEGVYFYKAVISLKEDEAEQYDYTERKMWELLIARTKDTLVHEYHLDYDTMQYVASFHTEKGHPHCHIIFFDNYTGGRARPRVNYDKIKEELNKVVYQEDIKDIHLITNQLKKPEEFRKNLENDDVLLYNNNRRLFDHKIKDNNLREIANDISNFRNEIKLAYKEGTLKGRLSQGFLPKEYKKELRNISVKIYNSSPAIRGQIDNFVNAVIKEKEIVMASSNDKNKKQIINNYANRQYENMMKTLDNQILYYIKQLDMQEKKEIPIARNSSLSYSYKGDDVLRNLDDLLRDMYQFVKSPNDQLRNYNRYKTYIPLQTKAQKREWYFKNRDRGLFGREQ